MATRAKGNKREPRAKRVQFQLDDPSAHEVAVTGSFCGWADVYPLKREKDGAWTRTMNLPPGRYEYRFVIDGQWREDPQSVDKVPNPYGGMNSVLEIS